MDAMFFIVLGATLASFLLTLLFGRFVIPMLRALHAGQSIREVGPQWHNTKAGTPTMGGIMFIAAIILCIFRPPSSIFIPAVSASSQPCCAFCAFSLICEDISFMEYANSSTEEA